MIIIDTNVVLDYVNERLAKHDEARLITLFSGRQYCISIITRIELQVGIENDPNREPILQFLQKATCIDIWPEIVAETVRIRTDARLKLPDAIIAATANYLGASLATNDTRGFSRVPGLELWAPERLA